MFDTTLAGIGGSELLFQVAVILLGAAFLRYGMDVRRKRASGDFVAPFWQTLMKLCSFVLMGGAIWAALSVRRPDAADWLGLGWMALGTGFVAAAKRALGKAHTFTGQYLERPQLITHGIYRATRNPLYFGVLQCELAASLIVARQAPVMAPDSYPYWLGLFGAAMLYAVVFNWTMAVREAHYLERVFGAGYRQYRRNVPFFFPTVRSKEVQ